MNHCQKERLRYACDLFLRTYDHPSRKADMERAVKLLRDALQEQPPALGVAVRDNVETADKAG